MIKYNVGNLQTSVRQWKFPDGCVGVDINIGSMRVDHLVGDVRITCIFGSEGFTINDDLIALAFVNEAVRMQFPRADIHLDLPYTPYARQDRAVTPGEAFSLKVIGKMINGMGFTTVTVTDPHSSVAAACIDRMYVVDQFEVFNGIRQSFHNTYIVAPDAGASKKCEEFAKRVGAAGVITCAKTRELSTGKITGFKVLDEVPEDADLLVLDDLCDGGRTFIEVANVLLTHVPYRLDLAITHGLFTKGPNVVTDIYEKVFTTNSFISDKSGTIVIDLG